MKHEGPSLDPLLHRLADCPPEFLNVAGRNNSDGIDAIAVACDLLRTLSPEKPPELFADFLPELRKQSEQELRLTSIICWLLSDEWFLSRHHLSQLVRKMLTSASTASISKLVNAEKFVADADRREELVRFCLAQLELRPLGETVAQATDRLAMLDTGERLRVLHATAAAEKRAREIREAMARRQAQEAASRYGE